MQRRRALGAALLASALIVGLLLLFRGSTPAERAGPRVSSSAAPAAAPAPPAASAFDPPASPVVPPAVVAPAVVTQPPEEDAYLQQLLELNRTDKPRALELARRGDDWYAHEGVKAEARKAMIVTLLVDLGRMPEARAQARELMRRYPESRYLPLVQGVTGIHPRPGAPAQPR